MITSTRNAADVEYDPLAQSNNCVGNHDTLAQSTPTTITTTTTDGQSASRIFQMGKVLELLIVFTVLGIAMLLLVYFFNDVISFFALSAVGYGLLFFTNPAITTALMFSVPESKWNTYLLLFCIVSYHNQVKYLTFRESAVCVRNNECSYSCIG